MLGLIVSFCFPLYVAGEAAREGSLTQAAAELALARHVVRADSCKHSRW